MQTNEDEKNLIIDLLGWLPKMLSGKTLEAVYSDGSTETVTDVSCLIKDIKAGLTFRVKASEHPVGSLKPKEAVEIDCRLWYLPVKIGQEPDRAGNKQVWCPTKRGEDFIYVDPERLISQVVSSKQPNPLDENEPKGEKLGGVHAEPIDRPGEMVNPLKGLKVRRGIS